MTPMCYHQRPQPPRPAPGVAEDQAHHQVAETRSEPPLIEVVHPAQNTGYQDRAVLAEPPQLLQPGDQVPDHHHFLGEALANAEKISTGMRHQVSCSADGSTWAFIPPSHRAARYSSRPGRPISAARPRPPRMSERQRSRPSPSRAGLVPLRHNRYRPRAPPGHQLRDGGQVQAEVDQVVARQVGIQPNSASG